MNKECRARCEERHCLGNLWEEAYWHCLAECGDRDAPGIILLSHYVPAPRRPQPEGVNRVRGDG